MREILFRGQDAENGEWVYGYYVHFECKHEVFNAIYTGCTDDYLGRLFTDCYDVKPETVSQYTGIKDKNGVRVFEGDILNVFYNPNYVGVSKDRVGNFVAVFHDGCFMKRKITKPMSDDAGLYHFIYSDEFEVIGNIYDNPEVLEGEKNG